MKKYPIVTLLTLLLVLTPLMVLSESFVNQITDDRMTRSFTEEAVDKADLLAIIQAGLAATSAMNSQPWFFSVVTNKDIMAEISSSGGMPRELPGGAPPAGDTARGGPPSDNANVGDPSVILSNMPAPPRNSPSMAKASVGSTPVAVVIYTEPAKSTNASFDCGLAGQNMVNAAMSLGYGTKIVTSPTITLNGDQHDALCEKLGVNTGMEAVAVLLIGHSTDDADVISSASTRLSIREKVVFIK